MSFTYLDDRSVYEERCDKATVAICRDREEMVRKLLGERPPLNSRGEAEWDNGYYHYSIMYFQLVETMAGERWQQREETTNWRLMSEGVSHRLGYLSGRLRAYESEEETAHAGREADQGWPAQEPRLHSPRRPPSQLHSRSSQLQSARAEARSAPYECAGYSIPTSTYSSRQSRVKDRRRKHASARRRDRKTNALTLHLH